MGLASPACFQLCAYLVSLGLQPTFIPWQRRWRPTLPSRDLCWRSIIAVTADPSTIATPTITRFPDGAKLTYMLRCMRDVLETITLERLEKRMDEATEQAVERTVERRRSESEGTRLQ